MMATATKGKQGEEELVAEIQEKGCIDMKRMNECCVGSALVVLRGKGAVCIGCNELQEQ